MCKMYVLDSQSKKNTWCYNLYNFRLLIYIKIINKKKEMNKDFGASFNTGMFSCLAAFIFPIFIM